MEKKDEEELEKLFEEKYQNLKMEENYKKDLAKYNDDIENFFGKISKDQIDELDEILSASNKLSYEECKKCFILGFKTATRLIFESVKE